MLQRLAIRQALLALDWLLILLIFAGALFVALDVLNVKGDGGGSSGTEVTDGAPVSGSLLAQLKPRNAYDSIVKSRLFGQVGQVASTGPVVPVVKDPDPDPEPAPAHLKLVGTSATTPTDIYATATILNEKKNILGTFAVGQMVMEEVFLEEVYPRRVILMNRRLNRREVLKADGEEDGPTPGKPTTATRTAARTSGPSKQIAVDKNKLVQELFVNYTDIITKIQPDMYRDANGKIAGITASNLESLPMAAELDLRNDDVLQSVNNEKIDSENKVFELIQKYRNSSMVRIGLLRDGKPVTVTYRLK
ncbi:MAG: hypothetical protein GWP08_13175 [Nitrospiraceae bacterium]|nr:hypothetical protein [Nitrospiraceae bacterium]